MGRSLGLAAYRALSRRTDASKGDAPYPDRPGDTLLWMHASESSQINALDALAKRLKHLRPEVSALLTCSEDTANALPDSLSGCDVCVVLSTDHPHDTRRFLDHWHPDIGLWAGSSMMPNLLTIAADKGIEMILFDVASVDFRNARHRWFPDLTRVSLNSFARILVNSTEARTAFERLGIAPAKLSLSSPLQLSTTPPMASDEDLASVSRDLAGRPVWLAAGCTPQSAVQILQAHQTALRMSHRLLLILSLQQDADRDQIDAALAQANLKCADWDAADVIEDSTQVLLSAYEDDLGLWYRLAPVTAMADTLAPETGGHTPMNAAALGSAILHGPHVAAHRAIYEQLAQAGASHIVTHVNALGHALLQLIAPDRAASMALAGWNIATQSAELTDRLIDIVQDRLDQQEARHARA